MKKSKVDTWNLKRHPQIFTVWSTNSFQYSKIKKIVKLQFHTLRKIFCDPVYPCKGYDPDETLEVTVYDNEEIKIKSSGMYYSSGKNIFVSSFEI